MTFSRRSSAFIANARVSSSETPNSSWPSSYHGGISTPSAAGPGLGERAHDRVAVAVVLLGHLAQEARAERDVPVLVARDLVEALDEAGQRAVLLVVADDEVLAREGEHALDDHVVERDRLDQRLEVLGLAREPVDARAEHLVEQRVEVRVQVRARLLEPRVQVVRLEHADLRVEAVEERDVPRLVGDLRAEEDAHLLVGRGAHHRAELGGHALLADEERRQPVHALVALLLGDPLVPVDPVLGEVEVLHAPLLPLPQAVELRRSSGGSRRRGRRRPGARGRSWPGSPRAPCAWRRRHSRLRSLGAGLGGGHDADVALRALALVRLVRAGGRRARARRSRSRRSTGGCRRS